MIKLIYLSNPPAPFLKGEMHSLGIYWIELVLIILNDCPLTVNKYKPMDNSLRFISWVGWVVVCGF
jgi:hypothetical protein